MMATMKIFIFGLLLALVSSRHTKTKPAIWQLDQSSKSTDDDQESIDKSTQQIKQQIAQINKRLSEEDKAIMIMEADDDNPPGYDCTHEVMEIKEVSFTDQIRCYNTTEEVCSQTHMTIFESRTEKQCDTHFKKVCWVDYKDMSTTEVVRVCNKKPERQCNLSPEEKAKVKIVRECRDHYESICQTRYVSKNVTEDKVTCQTTTDQMCDEQGQCVDFPQKKCTTEQVETLKVIPNTGCQQVKKPVCTDPICPLVVEREVCSDIEKTFVRKVPKETCEIHPREVCYDVQKQYPKLKTESECQYLPRETCTPERVRPKETKQPIIKKVCSKTQTNSVPIPATKVFKGCEEQDRNGTYQIATYLGDNLVTLWCDGSKTILQKRQYTNPNDETYFEKSWKEYKNGFEKSASNIWMGLDIAHNLTTHHHYTHLEVTINGNDSFTRSGFTVGPESNGYAIQLGEKSLQFSAGTVDNDNLVNEACMNLHSGGWWYDDCGDMNLNGRLNANGSLSKKDAFYNNADDIPVKVYSSIITLSKAIKCAQGWFLLDGQCQACGCNAQGSSGLDCDLNGDCLCLDGYTGPNCEKCSFGYYGSNCTACECDAQGSSNPNGTGCDAVTGQCLCREGYTGTKCNLCSEGFVRQEEGGQCLQTVSKQCPDGWKAIGGKCYIASTESATWDEANQRCSSLGGKLVEPLSSQEDSDVAAFMKEPHGSQRYWIGLSDQVEESKFVFASGLAATYFNWRPNQPDNAGDKEDCIEVCPDVNDQWNDQDCQTSNPFACEMN